MISGNRLDQDAAGFGEGGWDPLASDSVTPPRRGRPAAGNRGRTKKILRKPYPSFPLTPHSCGQFVKKIRGKYRYFGSDPNEALRRYHEEAADLHAGREPTRKPSLELSVGELANRFLAEKQVQFDTGQLTAGCFDDYLKECERLIKYFGKGREVATISDGHMTALLKHLSQGIGPATLKRRVVIVRMIFLFAFNEGLIAKPLPLRKLKMPSPKQLRQHRAGAGRKHLHAQEIKALIESASPRLKAAILLAINCGYGNKDIALLRLSDIDLEGGWCRLDRSKTGVSRSCPLWPETIEAILAYIRSGLAVEDSKREAEARGLLFVTGNGLRMVRSIVKPGKGGRTRVVEHDVLSSEFKKEIKKHGIDLRGVSFYSLRHSFATIASETGNSVVVDHIMGHVTSERNTPAMYRHGIATELLKEVTGHVRARVFSGGPEPARQAS